MIDSKTVKEKLSQHYATKLMDFGATPRGVDWGSEIAQTVRFEQLLRLFPSHFFNPPVVTPNLPVVLDFGCGYGGFFPFLQQKIKIPFQFIGFDALPEMIEMAKKNYPNQTNLTWTNQFSTENKVNFITASGVFNVKADISNQDWQEYVVHTLHQFDAATTDGFAFNLLSLYSDIPKRRDYLFFADALFFFDYCKRHFAANVALLHDYGHWDFTIIVKKYH
ncbi:MAG: hypothetical protein RL757_1624 [Bacteroidota bacterium]|jgi:SAM-dependent methyltransferase